MISIISAYIDARVKSVDSDLNRWDEDVFGDNETTENIADSYYKLWYGNTSTTRDGTIYQDEIAINVEIYSSRTNDIVPAFEDTYDKALSIRDAIIAPCDAKNNADFTDIFAGEVIPSPLDTDDNTVRITIELTVRRDNYFTL